MKTCWMFVGENRTTFNKMKKTLFKMQKEEAYVNVSLGARNVKPSDDGAYEEVK